MAKKKQKTVNPTPEQPLNSVETLPKAINGKPPAAEGSPALHGGQRTSNAPSLDEQREGALVLLKSILDPINNTLQEVIKQQGAQAQAIKMLLERPQPTGFQLPKIIQDLIPDLANAAIKFFTQPETPPEQSKMGLFDEELFKGYKDNMMTGWKIGQDLLKEQFEQLRLDNELRRKKMTEEF